MDNFREHRQVVLLKITTVVGENTLLDRNGTPSTNVSISLMNSRVNNFQFFPIPRQIVKSQIKLYYIYIVIQLIFRQLIYSNKATRNVKSVSIFFVMIKSYKNFRYLQKEMSHRLFSFSRIAVHTRTYKHIQGVPFVH